MAQEPGKEPGKTLHSNTFIARDLGTPPRDLRWLDTADRILRRYAPWMRVSSAWRGMANVESRMNSFHLLDQVIAYGVPGDIVEIGCNQGETTVLLQRMVQDLDPSREVHAFDSFCGVPPAAPEDEHAYKEGDMAASLPTFLSHFDKLGLPRPRVHQGWFDQTLPAGLPETIAYAFLDADLYRSTLHALNCVYPRLSPGGICVFGVYWDPKTDIPTTRQLSYRSPGVKKASDEFLRGKPERVRVLYTGNFTMGYFRKV
jgi:O-methyltransferase